MLALWSTGVAMVLSDSLVYWLTPPRHHKNNEKFKNSLSKQGDNLQLLFLSLCCCGDVRL